MVGSERAPYLFATLLEVIVCLTNSLAEKC
jgi:hypothetical protein